MIQSRGILLCVGLALAATPALAGSLNDGRYRLTVLANPSQSATDTPASAGLGSLRSLGSANDLFANSRGGDQGAPVPRGPSGTGKTMSADVLAKNDGGPPAGAGGLTDGGGKPPTQAMGDGSVRFIRDSISTPPTAKPGGGVPTGTVTFKVDGPAPTGGGAAKGPATLRR
ncbi:MAG: hypothetical protein JNM30_06135 [Rhodospirillales bacterium]|nr:hypothetical protein [Rhodospirillales bacterium]